MQRRGFLNILAGALAATMLPINALADTLGWFSWSTTAFGATKLNYAMEYLDIQGETPSKDIEIVAPDRAENGAVVQIEITSNIANTESITVLVEHNPTPLIGIFNFSNGALPFVITRIKMAEDSDVKVIVKADGKYFSNAKKVVVLENGCG
jgi:sulfur-oxidizing protein SoxY